MPLTQGQEDAIDTLGQLLNHHMNQMSRILNALDKLKDQDVFWDEAILEVDAGFDTAQMYTKILSKLKNAARLIAVDMVDTLT